MEATFIFGGLILLAVISAGYSYGTKFNKKITVDEKFERVYGNKEMTRQIFSVSDMDNNVYKVSKSLWYWKWYSTETWNGMKKGETYNIKGYGLRCGFLNLYPNIISAEKIETTE
jgi:hypothetical protein